MIFLPGCLFGGILKEPEPPTKAFLGLRVIENDTEGAPQQPAAMADDDAY